MIKNCFTKKNKGFTLVEVLVSVSITMMVVTIVYNSYFAVTDAIQRTEARIEREREIRGVLGSLDSDLKSLLIERGSRNYYIEGEEEKIKFTMTGDIIAPQKKWSDLLVVEYRFDEEKKELQRKLNDLRHEMAKESEDYYPVISGIEEFTLQYYDGKEYRNNYSSILDVRTEIRAVKYRFVLKAGEGTEIYEKNIPL